MPDVFWMHSSQHIRYAQSGMLMDLNEVIENSDVLDMSNFTEGIVDLYNVDGKQIAIPKDVSTIGLWYNKTLFDEAGVTSTLTLIPGFCSSKASAIARIPGSCPLSQIE